jgi:hypothetical protein
MSQRGERVLLFAGPDHRNYRSAMQIRRRLESGGFEIGDEPRFPLRHPRSPVHNARRLALDGPSMRDPKMSRSETAGLVAEMTDATATKSAKTVKK